jgi:hypothetical protein
MINFDIRESCVGLFDANSSNICGALSPTLRLFSFLLFFLFAFFYSSFLPLALTFICIYITVLMRSFADSATALCWLPSVSNLLAVGTAGGWVRVYDARSGISAEMNIVAHTDPKSKAVKGVKADPFNPHIFATFSDVANEPIKVSILYFIIFKFLAYIFKIFNIQYVRFGICERWRNQKSLSYLRSIRSPRRPIADPWR